MTQSELERALETHIIWAGLPTPQLEYAFHPDRKWRFDFSWPAHMIAAEAEGGTWSQGRHVRGMGFANDCEKYNEAVIMGWRVLRFTSEMIEDGTAMEQLERMFNESN